MSTKKCGKMAMLDLKENTFYRHRCKGKKCRFVECREIYASKRLKELKVVVSENNLNRFFTLTLNPELHPDCEAAWENIAKVWHKFMRRIKRRYKGLKYIAVLEKHKKNDRPHIHGFWDKYIPQEVVAKHWEGSGGGEIVDIRAVQGDISEYVNKQLKVAKYVGKDNVNVGDFIRKRKRVVWKSRGLKAEGLKKESDGRWKIAKEEIFNDDGKILLTDCELNDRFNALTGYYTFEREAGYEENKRVWEYMEGAFTEIPARSIEKSEQNVEAKGREDKQAANSGSEKTARCDKRQDKKRVRQIEFLWESENDSEHEVCEEFGSSQHNDPQSNGGVCRLGSKSGGRVQ